MATENKYQKSIDRLNQAIGKEIATTLQYLYFHVHFEDDGYEYFSKMMKQTSITEMFHTDKIADRILFLQGEVEMMPSFEPRKIRDVKEALEFSMTLEQRTVDSYNEWARLCAAEDDQITHKLFQDLAKEEEEHLDMFRTEMENMLNYGEQYLALQSIAHSKELLKITGSGEALLKNGEDVRFSAVSGDNGSKKMLSLIQCQQKTTEK